MKILHVHQSYLPYKGGSSMRLSQILEANINENQKCEQHVLVTRKNIPEDVSTYEKINGVHVHRVASYLEISRKFLQLNRKEKFDIVHVHNPRPFWYIYPFWIGKPIIIEMHSLQEMTKSKEFLTSIIYKVTNHIFVLTDSTKNFLIQNNRIKENKITVLPNAVDINKISKIANREISEKSFFEKNFNKTIGYVGSLHKWQGIYELLYSFKILNETHKSIKLLIVGSGPELENFQKEVKKLKLNDFVEVREAVSHETAINLIKKLDLFCILRPKTRATELTTPMKIFEIAAVKTPLLVTNRPAILEIFESDPVNFLYIEESLNPNDISKKIISILSTDNVIERELKAEKFHQFVVKKNMSWNVTAFKQFNVYKQLLGKE